MDKNKVVLEGNEPTIVLSEDTRNKGYIEVEEARNLLVQLITACCEKLGMKR